MMNIADRNDTICAPATIPGTGAVSMIRVSGARALEITDRVVSFRKGSASESKGGRVKFACVYKDGELLDEVLVSIFRAPHSYTGEDSAEISCHASAYIVSELLALLCKEGCRLANPGEFTQRAFINGKMDLTQAEAVADVISSNTAASHRVALKQLKGGFSGELSELRSRLLEMASLMELELDFSEEDVEFADRGRLGSLLDRVMGKIERLRSSFRLGNAIKNGAPVAIVGAANAGKSTLLNAILGEQRAIVSDIAGTTRDTIEECFNVDGVLFRFVDTAGIRNPGSDSIESIGIQRSFESMKKARIILIVIDSAAPDSESLEAILRHIDFESQKVVFVLNKSDIEGGSSADGNGDGIEVDDSGNNVDGIGWPEGGNKNVTDINNTVSLADFKKTSAGYELKQGKQPEIIMMSHDIRTEAAYSDYIGNKNVTVTDDQAEINTENSDYGAGTEISGYPGCGHEYGTSSITNTGSVAGTTNTDNIGNKHLLGTTEDIEVSVANTDIMEPAHQARSGYEHASVSAPDEINCRHAAGAIKQIKISLPGPLPHVCGHAAGAIKQIRISAKTGEGVPELLSMLAAMEKSELSRASEESVLITNMRHYQALTLAAEELGKVRSGINDGSPTDLVAEDLRSALSTLGSITGEISTQDVLNNIFRNFCIGK